MRPRTALLAAATLVLTAAPPYASPPPPRPGIVLITVDSLRADRLGCYGRGGGATPRIDALAKRAWRFARAYSASPSTVASTATLLTGADPRVHGLRHDAGGRLREGVATVAERLSAAGYATGAVVGSFRLDSDRGLDRGFGVYDDAIEALRKEVVGRARERGADEVVRRGLRFIEEAGERRPFFLWLNFYDPHHDYAPPAGLPSASPGERYAAEVAHVDAQIGVLLDALRARRAGAHVVLAGSHGEALGEAGEKGHGVHLGEATIRVPLLVAPAGGAEGRVVEGPAGLVDLAPTVLDLAGVKPPQGMEGRSLLRRAAGEAGGRACFAESLAPLEMAGWSPLFAVIDGARKVVGGRRLEAFDLGADPAGERPLDPLPAWAADLERRGRDRLGPLPPDAPRRRAVVAAAKSLDLPWRGRPGCAAIETGIVDPRDRGALVEPLFRARLAVDHALLGRAAKIAEEEILKAEPTNPAALEIVATLAARNGWNEPFLKRIETLQCAFPARGAAYHLWGHHLEREGKLAAAIEAMKVFVVAEPENEEGYYDLAVLHAASGGKDEALRHLSASMKRGAEDIDYIRRDPRLKSLHDDPRFIRLVGPIKGGA